MFVGGKMMIVDQYEVMHFAEHKMAVFAGEPVHLAANMMVGKLVRVVDDNPVRIAQDKRVPVDGNKLVLFAGNKLVYTWADTDKPVLVAPVQEGATTGYTSGHYVFQCP